MSHAPAGRALPRWSRPLTGAFAQVVASPASRAGLPAVRAMVWVGPPLSFGPASRPSWAVVRTWLVPLAPLLSAKQAGSSARLFLVLVSALERAPLTKVQLGLAPFASRVFVSVAPPPLSSN